jgi:hypothetical protein
MHFDIGVTLVIHQADIVVRSMLFDQVHLQDQGLELGTDHDPFNIRNMVHQLACFAIFLGTGVKIRAQAVPQIDCLTDVDILLIHIFHEIAAWFKWGSVQNSLEMFRYVHRASILSLLRLRVKVEPKVTQSPLILQHLVGVV